MLCVELKQYFSCIVVPGPCAGPGWEGVFPPSLILSLAAQLRAWCTAVGTELAQRILYEVS